jgi:histidinol dehydrogenase
MIKLYTYPKDQIAIEPIESADVSTSVSEIISDVRERGDSALREYTERFDRARLSALEVAPEEIGSALSKADPGLVSILSEAAQNIRAFHENQISPDFELKKLDGSILGQRTRALARVGVYVPGGTASYPSTVLMNVIPAKLAGVPEVVMVTPPAPDGSVSPNILAAAKIAGADRVFKVGGAQAVAALAYGTDSVPAVDKIVGPGNIYVAEAKRQVFGRVDIDMVAGPSEILIIADRTCNARIAAADLLSQAEHDAFASAILITDSPYLADKVAAELERQIDLLPRKEIARASIDSRGKIVLVENLEDAVALSNALAPEHLEICVDDPLPLFEKVENAGSVFLGKYSPEALGDYFAGPNHTLPTAGTARFSSPLSVYDFVKRFSYINYTRSALAGCAEKIVKFAKAEGLDAHARSVLARFEGEDTK